MAHGGSEGFKLQVDGHGGWELLQLILINLCQGRLSPPRLVHLVLANNIFGIVLHHLVLPFIKVPAPIGANLLWLFATGGLQWRLQLSYRVGETCMSDRVHTSSEV
jgi:hypothetical protein